MKRIAWTTLGATLVLAGCNQPSSNTAATGQGAGNTAALPALPGAVPLQAGPATAPVAAPPAAALPAAAAVQMAGVAQPSDAYAYLDRASGFSDAIGDAPPDYGFDYDGVRPWAWQAGDGDTQFAEPVDGGYRYYYYQPGEDYPYLVRDPSYSYAYDGPDLVAVYGAGGALLAGAAYRAHADAASRYRARAEALYRASREREHRGVVAANWAARRSEIAASQARWSADRERQADWQAYHESHETAEQDHWSVERQRRVASAQQFDGWRRNGFRGAPPLVDPEPSRPEPGRPMRTGAGQAGSGQAGPGQAALGRGDARPALPPQAGDRGRPDRGSEQRRPPQPFRGDRALPGSRPSASRDDRGQPAGHPDRPEPTRPVPAAPRDSRFAPDRMQRTPHVPEGPARSDTTVGVSRFDRPSVEPSRHVRPAAPRPDVLRAAPTAPDRAQDHPAVPAPQMLPRPEHRSLPARAPAPHVEPPHAAAPHVEVPRPPMPHEAPRPPAPHVEAPHPTAHAAPAPPRGGGEHHH